MPGVPPLAAVPPVERRLADTGMPRNDGGLLGVSGVPTLEEGLRMDRDAEAGRPPPPLPPPADIDDGVGVEGAAAVAAGAAATMSHTRRGRDPRAILAIWVSSSSRRPVASSGRYASAKWKRCG
jgi:hypothetical protein